MSLNTYYTLRKMALVRYCNIHDKENLLIASAAATDAERVRVVDYLHRIVWEQPEPDLRDGDEAIYEARKEQEWEQLQWLRDEIMGRTEK